MKKVFLALLLCFNLVANEGKIYFRSEPSGAEVIIAANSLDNAKKFGSGKTPCLVVVPFGSYSVKFSFKDYLDKWVPLEVKSDSIIKPDVVKLDMALISVDIIFLHEDWQVWLDGKPYEKDGAVVLAPATIKIPGGKHEVRLVKFGYQDININFDFSNDTKYVSFEKHEPKRGISSIKKINLKDQHKSTIELVKSGKFDFDNFTEKQLQEVLNWISGEYTEKVPCSNKNYIVTIDKNSVIMGPHKGNINLSKNKIIIYWQTTKNIYELNLKDNNDLHGHNITKHHLVQFIKN